LAWIFFDVADAFFLLLFSSLRVFCTRGTPLILITIHSSLTRSYQPILKPLLKTATAGLQEASGEVINSYDQYEVFNDPRAVRSVLHRALLIMNDLYDLAV
jgi:Heterokaryon incompatibility protein Het-C